MKKEETEIRMRVYIAGPMNGYENHNLAAFASAAELWRRKGFEVVSPGEINHGEGMVVGTNEECLRKDLHALLDCDAVTFLDGWESSVGARAEAAVALVTGKKFLRLDKEGKVKEYTIEKVLVNGYRKPTRDEDEEALALDRIQAALRVRFSNESDQIVLKPIGQGRVSGCVISKSFDGESIPNRQAMVWQTLPPEARRVISVLLTLTLSESKEFLVEKDEDEELTEALRIAITFC